MMLLPSTRLSCIGQYHPRQLQRTWACTEVKAEAAEGSKNKIKALLSIQTGTARSTNQNGDSRIPVPIRPLARCSVLCFPSQAVFSSQGPSRLTLFPKVSPHPRAPTAIQRSAMSSPELSSLFGMFCWKVSSLLQLSRREHEG